MATTLSNGSPMLMEEDFALGPCGRRLLQGAVHAEFLEIRDTGAARGFCSNNICHELKAAGYGCLRTRGSSAAARRWVSWGTRYVRSLQLALAQVVPRWVALSSTSTRGLHELGEWSQISIRSRSQPGTQPLTSITVCHGIYAQRREWNLMGPVPLGFASSMSPGRCPFTKLRLAPLKSSSIWA
jgi:hypothetical protein